MDEEFSADPPCYRCGAGDHGWPACDTAAIFYHCITDGQGQFRPGDATLIIRIRHWEVEAHAEGYCGA